MRLDGVKTGNSNRRLVGLVQGCSDVWISKPAHSFRSALGAKYIGKLGTSPNQTDGIPKVEGQERWNKYRSETGDSRHHRRDGCNNRRLRLTRVASVHEIPVPIQPGPEHERGVSDIRSMDASFAQCRKSQRLSNVLWSTANPVFGSKLCSAEVVDAVVLICGLCLGESTQNFPQTFTFNQESDKRCWGESPRAKPSASDQRPSMGLTARKGPPSTKSPLFLRRKGCEKL